MKNGDYKPFGKEWKLEFKKWKKDDLIDHLRTVLIELQQVKDNVVLPDVRLSSDVCDSRITKYADTLDIPEGQDQYTHDTAFINGAIWMRGKIGKMQQDEA